MYSLFFSLSRPEKLPKSRLFLTFCRKAGIMPMIVPRSGASDLENEPAAESEDAAFGESEVTGINKQRFLPELGKLLTFMVEEDRQTALGMYSRLFDDAEDEQRLMDLLVSPTRQAVVIARTYDAKARKQQLEDAEGENGEETPAFVLAIDKLYQQVAPKREERWEEPAKPEELKPELNQFSLFEDDAHPIDDSEYVPFQIEAEAVPLEEAVEQLPLEKQESTAETQSEEEDAAEAQAQEEDDPAAEAEEPAPAETEPVPQEEAALPEEKPEEAETAPAPQEPAQTQPAPEQRMKTAPLSAADYDLDFIAETRRKPRVFLLILFTLLAIPVTLAGIVLLLIPTVVARALAVLVIVMGSATLVAAFSGFPKLADLLIVIGTSVIVLALGLLLLWLFVWFVGGAIGGLIRGVIDLGRKWCYKEVPV